MNAAIFYTKPFEWRQNQCNSLFYSTKICISSRLSQKHLVSLTLDLNDSWDVSRGSETDDVILTGLLQRLQNSLKTFFFYASSIRVVAIEDIPLVNSRVVFDCETF
jgi:hypothetical protein